MEIAHLIQVIVSGLFLGGIYALISVGLNLLFGIMKIVNFAHAEFLMLAMYASYWLNALLGIDPFLSVPISAFILFIAGILIQKFLIKPILDAPEDARLLVTLGVAIILQNLALVMWHSDYKTVYVSYAHSSTDVGSIRISTSRLIAFIIALFLMCAFYVWIKRTDTGKAIQATAQNKKAAILMGINIDRIHLLVFGLSSALAGIAGTLLTPVYSVYPSVGSLFGLTSYCVVTLGGLGNYVGAFFGGIILGVVEALGGFFFDPGYKLAVVYAVFILVLLFRPQGLFGKKR